MLALLYDVHGNLRALEAVLEDARDAGATRYLLGGDYAAFGAEPAETVAALRELEDATWIRGNWERWCAHPDQALEDPVVRGALEAALAALGAELVAELGALPEQLVLDGTRYSHASPKSDMDSFSPEPAEGEDELLAGATERRIVFGHTHVQFSRTREDGIELLNPGSVGLPFDGDVRAAYALVYDDGTVGRRRVAYDVEAAAAAMTDRYGGDEWAVETAERLRTARF